MEVYGVILIVTAVALFYALGMLTANWFNNKAEREKKYALERQFLRLRAGVDFYDPAGPYTCPATAGRLSEKPRKRGFSPAQLSEFEARLKDTGSAVVKLDRENPTTKNN